MMAAQVQMAVVARFADGSLDLPRDASRLATQWNESSLENEGNLQGKDRASGL
jgi:hypothetical protein